MEGIVIKNENGYFSVQLADGTIYPCKVKGRLKKDRYSLLVGDKVSIETIDEQNALIVDIHSRKNSLIRPYVANIDQVILVVAAHEPDINIGLMNKLLIMIEDSEIPLVICINKADLADEATQDLVTIYEKIGYRVIKTSTYTGEGIAELKNLLHDKITAFAGPSGVGKSSLLNAVEPNFQFKTGEISQKTKRGKHTTRHASLYSLDQTSFIIDTPGFSALEFANITKTRLPSLFIEFEQYTDDCKFNPCTHTHEPICGVKKALENNVIAASRYESYINFLNELKG